jgi:two-component system copper resistance phosphate regulon response regulator CusR
VLIVEDDMSLSKFLSRELNILKFAVDVCNDCESAFVHLQNSVYDLVILDLNLPGADGIAVLLRIRATVQRRLPILVLTARAGTADIVSAFENGADDYLAKPFSFQEMQARMRNLLRRQYNPVPQATPVGNLTMDRAGRRVMRGQRRVELTPREFSILECLMNNVGRPVSRASLMKEVWHISFDPTTNIVDVYMKYLRDKIDGEGEAKLIHTVRGVGYELRND